MGRPKIAVDPEQIKSLALIGASNQQIADRVGISHDTLQRRFLSLIRESRGEGEMRILSKTFDAAMKGNIRALELSLVNRVGWTLRPEVAISVVQNAAPPAPVLTEQTKAQLIDFHDKLIARARQHNGEDTRPGLPHF